MQEEGMRTAQNTIFQWIQAQLNWFDLIIFGSAFLILGGILFFLLRKKRKVHTQKITALCETYEKNLQNIKRAHLEEIKKAEESVYSFKKKLLRVEEDFDKHLKKEKIAYSKRIQKIEKGYSKICSIDEMTIYELRSEISRLRIKQVNDIEAFESEVENLKDEIEKIHEGHAREIERAEMQISDLRKQMRVLMYRV